MNEAENLNNPLNASLPHIPSLFAEAAGGMIAGFNARGGSISDAVRVPLARPPPASLKAYSLRAGLLVSDTALRARPRPPMAPGLTRWW